MRFLKPIAVACVLSGLLTGSAGGQTTRPVERQFSVTTAEADEGRPDSIVLELEFMPQGFPLGMAAVQSSGGWLSLHRDKDGEIEGAPELEEDSSRYVGELALGPESEPNVFQMIVDVGAENILLLDSDQDGSFEGEEPQPTRNASGLGWELKLGMRYPTREGVVTEPYRLWLWHRKARTRYQAAFYATCCRAGKLEFGGQEHVAVLFDNPADGDYSNDRLIVDLDDDGGVDVGEQAAVGEAIRIGGTYLLVESISAAGHEVRLKPTKTPPDVSGRFHGEEAAVHTKIGGLVSEVNVHPGDIVHAGDVLIVLDDKEIRDRLAEIKAKRAEAESELDKAKLSIEEQDIARELIWTRVRSYANGIVTKVLRDGRLEGTRVSADDEVATIRTDRPARPKARATRPTGD